MTPSYQTKHFALFPFRHKNKTDMVMHVFHQARSTGDLPQTVALLKHYLPSVLEAKCFNQDDLPFCEEVKKTEVGHLFEHILLEYLCVEKVKSGVKKISYSGETTWKKKNISKFFITISAGDKDYDVWDEAMSKTIYLMNEILARPSPKSLN